MTEEEATTKRCCGPKGCGDTVTELSPVRYCIASACMAWQTTNTIAYRVGELGKPTRTSQPEGYCGLAGKP